MIGQCGLTWQECDGQQVLEVGYLFQRAFWHQGFATEAARACRNHAFNALGVSEVFSIIRDTNTASQNVARRNGMTPRFHAPYRLLNHARGVGYQQNVHRFTFPYVISVNISCFRRKWA